MRMRMLRQGLVLAAAWLPGMAAAELPFPSCGDDPGCDPSDYASYLFIEPGALPDDLVGGSVWKYVPDTGMDITGAWEISTGRPDVLIAVLDSGIRWREADLLRKLGLNTGELPVPAGCPDHDCNGDGVVNLDDFEGRSCFGRPIGDRPDDNNSVFDGGDLIAQCSDGVDDDENGYVDDIAGWDFQENDNDPFDDVDYGHGTGQAGDSTGEANNGGGFPGVAPNAMFMPLKVGDSFVAVGSDFAQAVVYAVDRGADVIQEALGALSASRFGQQAIDYAYRRGVPVVASAADEESRHHNFPAAYGHTLWVNSIRNGDGLIVEQTDTYDILNGCTNYGGHAWVAISSTSCSSEAVGRASGMAALLVSHGKNLIDRGELSPYPGLDAPFSAEEIRQIFRMAADDIDHSGEDDLTPFQLLTLLLSSFDDGLVFDSLRFPTRPGFDQYTGFGRANARAMLEVTEETIPPEADLSLDLPWFATVDPVRSPALPIHGSARAVRGNGFFTYFLQWGCGVQPDRFVTFANGASMTPLDDVELGVWDPAATAAACGFDPSQAIEDPDAHSVTLRLVVLDTLRNLGADQRTVAVHHDSDLLDYAPLQLGASGEASPALADVDGDGVLDIIYATSDGRVHAIRGRDGRELPGFPARTDPLPVHDSPAYASGEVELAHEAVIAAVAADDLDGDGRVEIVVASIEGKLYVFDDHGRRRPGFPVATDPALSAQPLRNRLNDLDPGIASAPSLADLDGLDGEPQLEIVLGAWDGHVYAWRADGTPVAGFPVRLGDRSRVDILASGQAVARPGASARSRGAKIVSSPAVGDLDGDGYPEIVIASNEEYGGAQGDTFSAFSPLFDGLQSVLGGELDLDVTGRVYALHHDGNLHDGNGDDSDSGAFRWVSPVPLLVSQLLPTVGTGTPGSVALADVDGSGTLTAAIFGTAGPALLLDADGQPALGTGPGGAPRVLAIDFPEGFPFGGGGAVPETAGSGDAPFFPALGSGAFGDLDGAPDGLPEYVAATTGLRKLIDVLSPGLQEFSHHQITAWDPRQGGVLPAFPRFMDDLQFFATPAIFDVDGDGRPEVVNGSGAYLMRGYDVEGRVPAGWPKFTHGWLITSPTPGDVTGDGRLEVVAGTREGNLYVWRTTSPAVESAVQWQGFGHDRRNSGNFESGVPAGAQPAPPARALRWALESIAIDFEILEAGAPAELAAALAQSFAGELLDRALARLGGGELSAAADLLTWIEVSLRTPPAIAEATAELRQRLADATRAAAQRVVSGVTCAPGDIGCDAALEEATRRLAVGDFAREIGIEAAAVRLWGRALSIAADL